jgi:S-adenosylmethionine:tRNA ribosyltransferase-isomerase
MLTKELDYYLPAELIAQQPAEIRSESRLLVLGRTTGSITDGRFSDVGGYLRKGDCLVLNDTKVLAARFYAARQSGGKLEGLFLKQQDRDLWEVMLKGLGKVKKGERIWLKDINDENYCCAEVIEKTSQGKCLLKVERQEPVQEILERIGFAPVPPYIKRNAGLKQAVVDKQRYQTVYAKQPGAVAAPTAGLHWTQELLDKIQENGVRIAYVTLHVGEGTFKPVTTETLEEHQIHEEWFSIDKRNAELINKTKKEGGRIIAVGTTSVRVLETAAASRNPQDSRPRGIRRIPETLVPEILKQNFSGDLSPGNFETKFLEGRGQVREGDGMTRLFILPGFKFAMIDAMITNFHLPHSTLLALVAAFAGLEAIMTAYKHAVEKRYRFYSYGDAMLII